MKITKDRIKELYADKRYQSYFDVGLFFVLIFSFHILYVIWNEYMDYWPIKDTVYKLFAWASSLLYDQSTWTLDNICDMHYWNEDKTIYFWNYHGYDSRVTVAPECTSLKQWMHWLFLMLIFPGPWKHKAWYIPVGLVIIEWTNVVRICGVLLMQVFWPNIHIHLFGNDINTFHLAHDYIFKVFFYFIIFLMWVLWVEKFYNPSIKNKQHE